MNRLGTQQTDYDMSIERRRLPLKHGLETHSSTSTSQLKPVYPVAHAQW